MLGEDQWHKPGQVETRQGHLGEKEVKRMVVFRNILPHQLEKSGVE